MTTKHSYESDKEAILSRLKKIEGQVRGVQRMLEDDRYCLDIVQQLTALVGAVDEVMLIVLRDHISGCVASAVRERGESDPHIKELMETLRKVLRR